MAAWRPDLYSLRLFVAVCEEGSIARAAERESIVPSAISKRLAEIESLSGVRLLMRGGRGMHPTPAGKAMLHHARQMLRITEKMQAELADYARGVSGSVRVVANISSIVATLPSDLSTYLRECPDVRLDVVERFSAQVVRAVREGACDIGICMDTVDMHELDVRAYEKDRLVVVYSPAHPLARLAAPRFSSVLEYALVGLDEESTMTRLLSAQALRLGRPINYRMHVAAFDIAFRMVAEDLAVCIAPYDAVRRFEKDLGLHWRVLSEPWAERRTVLCMRDVDALGAPARRLVEHLTQRAAQRGRHQAGIPDGKPWIGE